MILWILKSLLLISMGVTLVTLGIGILNISKGTKEETLKSNRMMQLRVFAQALAILIFSLFLFLRPH